MLVAKDHNLKYANALQRAEGFDHICNIARLTAERYLSRLALRHILPMNDFLTGERP